MAVRMLFLVCALLTSALGYAQQTQASGKLIYLELSELSVDTYVELHKEFASHPNFELVESCVPAKLVVVRVKNPNAIDASKDMEQIRAILRAARFNYVTQLDSYNDELFMNKCKAARYVRQ